MRAIVSVCLALTLLATPALADWDPGQPHKWVQYPDLTEMGADVNASMPYLLADDFLCTQTGPITDIHLWGSWYHDLPPFENPGMVIFTLSIHRDIPASQSPTGYSMPGEVIWMRTFEPDTFTYRRWAEGLQEGWIEPPMVWEPVGDTVCWQYNFSIDPTEAFIQQGSTVEPVVYWLDVQAQPLDQTTWFGWKTSMEHWNDDAVWVQGQEPYMGIWNELRYPMPHPYAPTSIDLAFVITTQGMPNELDFGDAPDPTYPTLLASDGARHVVQPGFCLGGLVDIEPDGQPTPLADGDDLGGMWDDEDGVVFIPPITQGAIAQVDVTASAQGVVDAWVDFNKDGDWADANEQILTGQVVFPGLNNLFFNVPLNARPGQTCSRFRFSSAGTPTYTGLAADGEVEDHLVHIEGQEWKWIQMPDLGEGTGIDVNDTQPFILADDFLCRAPGRLTEIYVWGSWLNDYLPYGFDPNAVEFTLSIHADIPAGPGGTDYSMPGEVLWMHHFGPGMYASGIWESGPEGWMDPPDLYQFPGDNTCWLYMFSIPPDQAFHQTGMPDSAVVYWLDVQAMPLDPMARFGWKTTTGHWNDDGVWGMGMEPYFGPWNELRYPAQHPWFGQSIDLAFALRSTYGTDVPDGATPEPFGLFQNTPNPFNPKTTIAYAVPDGGGHVMVEVYDVSGRHVRTLVDEFQTAGERSVEWDGRDDGGAPMASGVYFYRLSAPGIEESRKMLLLK